MPEVILEAGNPLDLRPEKLEDLATSIEQLDSTYKVRIAEKDPLKGFGVTWYEVLAIWLIIKGGETLYQQVLTKIIDLTIQWARKRMKTDTPEGTTGRPKHITIYDHKGNVAKAFIVWDTTALPEQPEIEDKTEEYQKHTPRPVPKVRE